MWSTGSLASSQRWLHMCVKDCYHPLHIPMEASSDDQNVSYTAFWIVKEMTWQHRVFLITYESVVSDIGSVIFLSVDSLMICLSCWERQLLPHGRTHFANTATRKICERRWCERVNSFREGLWCVSVRSISWLKGGGATQSRVKCGHRGFQRATRPRECIRKSESERRETLWVSELLS